jgi:hypothetical protein
MGRPFGSPNKGMLYALIRIGRQLKMAAKNPTNAAELAKAAMSYRKLLTRAMKYVPHDNYEAIQRVGAGLSALTKAFTALDNLASRDESKDGSRAPIDFDEHGEVTYSDFLTVQKIK